MLKPLFANPLTKQLLATFCLTLSMLTAHAAGQLPTVESETLDEKEFMFPKDLKGEKQDVLFLAITEGMENGTAQQEQLLKWEQALRESGGLANNQQAYYLIVMESPPFFVKGFIRKDMKAKFEKNVPINHLGILFVDDIKEFSKTTTFALDGQPTIVVASKTGEPTTVIKGSVTPEKLAELKAAVSK
jgi:hypothetical protein